MFDLLADSTKRRAMRKAIKELDQEQQIASENTSVVKRAYQEESSVEKAISQVKNRGAVNKAETTAVDLKNFKNWRSVDSVKSSSPRYVGNPFTKTKFPFYDEDDGDETGIATLGDVEEGKTKAPHKDKPQAQPVVRKQEPTPEVKPQPEKPVSSVNLIETLSKKKDEQMSEKTTSNFTQFEIIRNKNQEKLNEFRERAKKKIEEDSKANSVSVNDKKDDANKLKIEVVVPETKKIVIEKIKQVQVEKVKAPEKKPVNRKPRGKNKRKFDADVISSVDWK